MTIKNTLRDIKTVDTEILKRKPNFEELEADYFFMIPNGTIPALRKYKLGAGDICIYLFMLSLANGYSESICYPSTKTFQKVLGLSRTQVITSKRRLEELGLITLVKKGGNKWGEKKANEYRVNYVTTREIPKEVTEAPGNRNILQEDTEALKGYEEYASIDYSKLL